MTEIALCLEQTLGHRAHTRNLEAFAESQELRVRRVHVDYAPGRGPWAWRGSWQAYRKLAAQPPARVTLFHTQTIALLAPVSTGGRPFVVSLDATPVQIDDLGRSYGHRRRHPLFEATKARWYRWALTRASAVVCWSNWAADSAVRDYGVHAGKILVAHPGAPQQFFSLERGKTNRPTILFVGGDFDRKGGYLLLDAFRTLQDRANLVMVTDHEVPQAPGVRVEAGVQPGSERLLEIYRSADIFCLPTLGDCTPLVIGEAMAAGLPVVTTGLGSNQESVPAGTGVIVPAGDVGSLAATLKELVDDPSHRTALGQSARDHAAAEMNSDANAERIFELLRDVSA